MDFVGIKSIDALIKMAERSQTQDPEGEKIDTLTSFEKSKLTPNLVPLSGTRIENPKPGETPRDSIETETKSQPYRADPVDGDKSNYGETTLNNLQAPQGEEVVIPNRDKSYW